VKGSYLGYAQHELSSGVKAAPAIRVMCCSDALLKVTTLLQGLPGAINKNGRSDVGRL